MTRGNNIAARVLSLLVGLVGCVASMAVCAAAPAAKMLRLEGDVWAPYVMDSADGRRGFMVDVAERALTRAGYQVSFAAVPWSRALLNVERGTVDGVVGIYATQAHAKGLVWVEEELGVSINTFYARQDSGWRYTGLSSLDAVRLAVIANYDYGELNAYVERLRQVGDLRLQVSSGNDVLQRNLRMLLADRVDVVVDDALVVDYVARHMDGDVAGRLRAVGTVEPRNRVGIAFAAQNPRAAEFAQALSDGIRKLRQSGELKTILDRYEVKDWK